MFTANSKTFTVKRTVLLNKLIENRALYEKELENAFHDYQFALIEALDTLRAKTASVEPKDRVSMLGELRISLPTPPGDKRDEYNEAIQMLTYAASEEVEIDSQTFKAWVLNDWSWMSSFKALAGSYNNARR